MPGFNRARKVEVSGHDNNCGLNCLVHVLSTCINSSTVNHRAKEALLEACKTEYGENYTWDNLVGELSNLTPRQRELKFSPVLRKLYAKAYEVVSSNFNLPQVQGQARPTLPHNTMVSNEELNILGYCFNINVESYLGDNFDEDLFAARGVQNPLRHNRPAATLKLWAPRPDSHYSFQLPDNMDLNAYNNARLNVPLAVPASNTNNKTNIPVEKKIDTFFSAFDNMFSKIFPTTNASNTDAKENSWLGSIKSFFSFLGPIIKLFVGFAAICAGDEEKPNTKTTAEAPANAQQQADPKANVQPSYAQQQAAAQARANAQQQPKVPCRPNAQPNPNFIPSGGPAPRRHPHLAPKPKHRSVHRAP